MKRIDVKTKRPYNKTLFIGIEAIICIVFFLMFIWPGWLVKNSKDSQQSGLVDDSKNEEVTSKLLTYQSSTNNYVRDLKTGRTFVNNEIIITAKNNVTRSQIDELVRLHGGTVVGYNLYLREYQIQLNQSQDTLSDIKKIGEEMEKSGLLEKTMPNYIMYMSENSTE